MEGADHDKDGPIHAKLVKGKAEGQGDQGDAGEVEVKAGAIAQEFVFKDTLEFGSGSDEPPAQEQQLPMLRDQDRYLPIANIGRKMAGTPGLPPFAKIQGDARKCMQECVSEFISFVTSEMAEIAKNEKRKTLSANDLIVALNNLGFENYVEPLTLYLNAYRAQTQQTTALFRDDEAEQLRVNSRSEGENEADGGVGIEDNGQLLEGVQDPKQNP